MTDKEKAVVMAYTGTCMLTGDKFRIFHKYIEDIMGRPIYTHDFPYIADEIRKKSEADFIALCKSDNERRCEWYEEYVNPIDHTRTFTFSDGTRIILDL